MSIKILLRDNTQRYCLDNFIETNLRDYLKVFIKRVLKRNYLEICIKSLLRKNIQKDYFEMLIEGLLRYFHLEITQRDDLEIYIERLLERLLTANILSNKFLREHT